MSAPEPPAMWARLGVPATISDGFGFAVTRLAGHRCWRQSLHCGHDHLAVQDLSEPAAARLAQRGPLALAETLGRWARTSIAAWDCICSGHAAGLGQYVFERMGGSGPLDPPPPLPAPTAPRWNQHLDHRLLAAGAILRHGAVIERQFAPAQDGSVGCLVRLLADGRLDSQRVVRVQDLQHLEAVDAAAEQLAESWLRRQGVDVEFVRRQG